MKNILITTDFSDNALDAAKFGIELGHKFHSKIHFLHVYSLPIVNSESPEMIDFSFYQQIKTEQLDKLINGIDTKFLKTYNHCLPGFSLATEINNFCNDNEIDLIIMGLTGASKIDQLFLGGNTQHVLTSSKVPVLGIPKDFVFPREVKIGFAFDGKKIKQTKNIEIFREIVKNINAFNVQTKIHAVHVSEENKIDEIYTDLKNIIPFDEFDLQIEINSHVNDGILEFIANNHIDLLAIIPRKHSFFDRLFHESYSKAIANYSAIPILTLPE